MNTQTYSDTPPPQRCGPYYMMCECVFPKRHHIISDNMRGSKTKYTNSNMYVNIVAVCWTVLICIVSMICQSSIANHLTNKSATQQSIRMQFGRYRSGFWVGLMHRFQCDSVHFIQTKQHFNNFEFRCLHWFPGIRHRNHRHRNSRLHSRHHHHLRLLNTKFIEEHSLPNNNVSNKPLTTSTLIFS